MLHVILTGTEDPGNVGAIARVMANFGFSHLLFIEPQCNPLDLVAMKRAKHAKDIIEDAPLVTPKVLDQFDLLVGTSAREDKTRGSLMLPSELREIDHKGKHIGLLFGAESTGLTKEYLDRCHRFVRIPTTEEYASMNLSHAVAILLYELSQN